MKKLVINVNMILILIHKDPDQNCFFIAFKPNNFLKLIPFKIMIMDDIEFKNNILRYYIIYVVVPCFNEIELLKIN